MMPQKCHVETHGKRKPYLGLGFVRHHGPFWADNILNDTSSSNHVRGGKVIAAYKGGSDDVESSYTRVDKFTAQLSDDFGVEIVESIEILCEKVDAILLESVDGRHHLEQARIVIKELNGSTGLVGKDPGRANISR